MRLQQKILIVDDDADIREVLNIQLTTSRVIRYLSQRTEWRRSKR